MQILRTKVKGVVTYKTEGLEHNFIGVIDNAHRLVISCPEGFPLDGVDLDSTVVGKMADKARRRDGISGVICSRALTVDMG